MAIGVDPRIELLGILQLLAGGGPTTTDLTFPYRREVEEHFMPYAGHPAVDMFKRMARVGFGFDAPVTVLLHCTEPPELALNPSLPAAMLQRASGVDSLSAWLALVRRFADQSGFAEFVARHEAYYGQLAASVRGLVEPGILPELEAYYGMHEEGYRIVLSPLTKGGFGPRVEVRPGHWLVYSVASPSAYSADTLRFYTADGLRTLIWHEFAHSFVNPLTDAHWPELAPDQSLLDSVAKGLPTWYREWKPALNEHIVRAVTVRLTSRYRGGETAQAALNQEVKWGFVYVPRIAALLAERYEADRSRWPDFASFYPEIVKLLDSMATGR